MASVTAASIQCQPKARIRLPATITPTEASASDRLCRKAARMFTLDFAIAQVSATVATSTASARPATITTIQPATGSGATSRVTPSASSQTAMTMSVV